MKRGDEIKIEGGNWKKARKANVDGFPGVVELQSAVPALDGQTLPVGTLVRALSGGADSASGKVVQTVSIQQVA